MPSADILEAVNELSERVKALREVLVNPDISSYRPVVNPERMVIKEALRAETYLALFGASNSAKLAGIWRSAMRRPNSR